MRRYCSELGGGGHIAEPHAHLNETLSALGCGKQVNWKLIAAVSDNMTRDSCIMGHVTRCLMISSTNVTLFCVNPFKTGRVKCLSNTVETRSITLLFTSSKR
jgi:hypothetical protein